MSKRYLLSLRSGIHVKEWLVSRNIYKTIHTNNRLLFKTINENSLRLESTVKRCPQLSSLVMRLCSTISQLDDSTYERIADQTLEQLSEELEDMIESDDDLKESDVSFNNGVMTLNLGLHGVYVINKQTPNKQIWLSSPVSGPKRYDYVDNDWIYKRDGISLNNTLSTELSELLNREIKFKSKPNLFTSFD